MFTLTEIQKAYLAGICAKSKHWKNNGGELGETLTDNADGNPEPSKALWPGRA